MTDIKRSIPAQAGIGLRWPHYNHILEEKPSVNWFEVHSENFFADGGMSLYILEKIRENYPLSMHGVGLSLGSVDGISSAHLIKLKSIIERFQPDLVSEHVSWSSVGGVVMNDLLPVPYNEESLKILSDNINKTQEFLGRQILVENPSSYLTYESSEISESDFMVSLAKKSGCKILLDVNNIYVSSKNHNFDAYEYVKKIPEHLVGEIHLAGHAINEIEGEKILIDHHGDYVADDVWKLYEFTIDTLGKKPTLIEWDTNIPAFADLQKEAAKADIILNRAGVKNAA